MTHVRITSKPAVSDDEFPAWWRGYWAAQAETPRHAGTFARWERWDGKGPTARFCYEQGVNQSRHGFDPSRPDIAALDTKR